MKINIGSTNAILLGVGAIGGFVAGATAKSMLHIDMPEKASNTKIFASGIIGAMVLGSAGFFAGKIGKACIPPAIDMVRSSINTFLQKKP